MKTKMPAKTKSLTKPLLSPRIMDLNPNFLMPNISNRSMWGQFRRFFGL